MPLPFTVVVSRPPRHERGGHPDRAGGKATTLLRVLQHIWQGGSETSWDNRHSEATQPAGDHDTQVAALRLGAWLCPTCLLRDLWVRKVASGRLDQRLGVPKRSVAAEGSEPRAAGMARTGSRPHRGWGQEGQGALKGTETKGPGAGFQGE